MPRLSKNTLIAFVAATLAGACLHFVYALAPNFVTAVFSPVNESLWEHVKIIFWPFLATALLLTRRGEKGCRGPWLLSLLMICAVMLGVGYVYHVKAMGESLVFDVVLYVLLMAAGFLLAVMLDRPAVRKRTDLLTLMVLALGVGLVLFAFLPPDNMLFTDLSGVNTWARIPC